MDEILFLSEDFIPQSEVGQISSGLDLIRSLERHNRLAPGKYNYLLACLKEIGRIDLVTTLTEFIYSCLLESMPSAFRAPSQMYAAKLHILMSKQSRYVEGMKTLQAAANNVNFWEEWISSTFHHLQKCSSNSSPILSEKVTIPELVHLILEGVVNVTVPWVGAVLAFLQGTSGTEVKSKLQDIQLHKVKLFDDLSGAGLSEEFLLTERSQHLDVAVSAASYALFDFLSELLGKAVDSERVGRFLKSLSAIESITPENCAFDTLPQLLLHLTKLAVSSSIQCREPLMKFILYQLKGIINCNKSKVLKILQGTQLEAKFSKMEQQVLEFGGKESTTLVYPPEINACPLVITIFVCFLALNSASELTPIQWKEVEMQLLQYLKSQLQQNTITTVKRLVPQVCGAMQYELDSFRDTSLTELIESDVGPGEKDHLQDLIASVFHY